MTRADDNLDQFERFSVDIWEAIQKHYPGAIEGETEPHASCTAAVTTIIGQLLIWRLAKGGEGAFKKTMEHVVYGIEQAARASWENAQKLRDELGAKYVPGTETKQ